MYTINLRLNYLSHTNTTIISQKNSFLQTTTRGFTLLEVLIAIFVIGMGIVSIVQLMTHNISVINRVHLQTTATTLAREGIEMVTNVRDTNTLLGYERNCAERMTTDEIIQLNNNPNNTITSLCKNLFRTGGISHARFTIDGGLVLSTNQIIMKKILGPSPLPESQLFLTGIIINNTMITGYTHLSGEKSFYSRYIEFTGMKAVSNNSPITNHIYPVRSIVRYDRNGMSGEVVFESFIADQE